MKLTICIPTVSTRESLLSRLLWGIERQLDGFTEVLIHTGDDIAMGDKYNRMFKEAKGDYVVCVDDDDYLSDIFLVEVNAAMYGNPDYIPYGILYTLNGKYVDEITSDMSGDHAWAKQPYGVLPKCVIRRDIAKDFEFPNKHSGDQEWARAVQTSGRVNSSQAIPNVLYYYDFWTDHSIGTQPGSPKFNKQRDVGKYPYNKEKFRWF